MRTGRDGDLPLGLGLDSTGCHFFDASKPSDFEHMLQHQPLDDPHLIERPRPQSEGYSTASFQNIMRLNPQPSPL